MRALKAREIKDAQIILAALFTRTEGAAWGHSSAGGALFSCLSSSVFPAGFNPFLFEELLLGTCCLQAMLFCQLTKGLFYCLGTGYTAGTPYKVPPTQSNTAPPPYSPSPNPYQTAMYPIRSAYPQQNLYAQVGTHGGPLLQEPPARMGGGHGMRKRKERSWVWTATFTVVSPKCHNIPARLLALPHSQRVERGVV